MRSWYLLVALASCAPNRPFRSAPPTPGPPCMDRPPLAADQPLDHLPIGDRDVDRDGQPDYIAATNCDAAGNCDLAVYLGAKSCARLIATVRGVAVFNSGSPDELVALEHVNLDGVEATHQVTWRRDVTGIWSQIADAMCQRKPNDTAERDNCAPLVAPAPPAEAPVFAPPSSVPPQGAP